MLRLLRSFVINGHTIYPAKIKTDVLKSTQRFNSSSATENEIASDEPVEMANPFEKEKVICILCASNVVPSYKNVQLLSQFQSPYTGRIYGRHITGLCKQQQEIVEKEIHKAQVCALMPAYHKDTKFIDDQKLFNPEKPIRPHKY